MQNVVRKLTFFEREVIVMNMKKSYKAIIAAVLVAFSVVSMAGCGNEESDLESNLERLDQMDAADAEAEIEKGLQGLDGGSTAEATSESAAIAQYLSKVLYVCAAGDLTEIGISNGTAPTDFNTYKYELLDETSGKIEAEIDGKTKKIKWNLDDADVYGKVDEKNFSCKYVTVTVDGVSYTYPEGADKKDYIDPFADLDVTFSGISPNSTVSLSGKNSYCYYTVSPEEGFYNGDVVTITAELAGTQSKELLEDTREYTVEGLAYYPTQLSDIPQETLDKFASQASDVLMAKYAKWQEGMQLDSLDSLGYYLLTSKSNNSPYNILYCVFKVSTTVTGQHPDMSGDQNVGNESYYAVVEFESYPNIITILADGTVSIDTSNYSISGSTIKSEYGYNSGWGSNYYSYGDGYSDLDTAFTKCVTQNIDSYNYESSVVEK